ncbi:hypothetical protein MBLNU459_g8154t1 [Dothideomycetes sp. NU459]
MCGDSSRTVQGGTIAVLKGINNMPDINLLFHSSDPTTTTATFQSAARDAHGDLERCQIVIHRDGDLRAQLDRSNILHSFSLGADSTTQRPGFDVFQLPAKLDLGAGGDGVIGRRVSLVRRSAMGATVLRQGIIGWN